MMDPISAVIYLLAALVGIIAVGFLGVVLAIRGLIHAWREGE